MKYLKRFEANKYKEPIDVESDVEEFWRVFGEKVKTSYGSSHIQRINSMIDELINEFGITITDDWNYYVVYESDDYGRNRGDIITVKAVNKNHAKLKAATIKDNLEIFLTGFYSSREVDLDKEILDTENSIKSLQKKLDELKNIK
jgi:hypothetical protein